MPAGTGGWAHRYDAETSVAAGRPAGPYAMYLAQADSRYRFIAFDLDAKHAGPQAVRRDAALLGRRLDAAGLAFAVCASGPRGGLHLWVPVTDPRGAPPALAHAIARGAALHCPTLDTAPLLNTRTGCLRPPGSPHRDGGFSRLLFPTDPSTLAALCEAGPNRLDRFERLARHLGAPPQPERGQEEAGGLIDTQAMRLVGRGRALPEATAALLEHSPADASAHLAKIFTGLALARWSLAEVEALVASRPRAPGLEHLRSQGGAGRRRPRSRTEQSALLRRQWGRVLAYASRAPRRDRRTRDTPRVRELVERVADIVSAVGRPRWWRVQSGPSDRKALLFVGAMALEALSEVVEVDCRRLADACGMTPSTASRALRRLILDGRLVLEKKGEGRTANAYRLRSPSAWGAQAIRFPSGPRGGTQAIPAQRGPAPSPTRQALLAAIRARLDHAAHDVWCERSPLGSSGLGRHVEATAWELGKTPQKHSLYGVDTVGESGYTAKTTARHLLRLLSCDLAEIRKGLPRLTTPAPARRDQAARRLGTAGTRARRMRHYRAERAAYAAWCSELERLRAPRGLPARRKAPYPRSPGGAPDHRTARRIAALRPRKGARSLRTGRPSHC
ncbi:hypothetical protein J0910_30150 [Nocardiopsis sp. CNT-189]|uniref:hypothetical protein n=1 Tax=Nocardiopsis oceanisediminis TaxID=2816862 RepID=UPI003B38501B